MENIYLIRDIEREEMFFEETPEEAYKTCIEIVNEIVDEQNERLCYFLELIESFEKDERNFGIDEMLTVQVVKKRKSNF